MWEEPNCSFSNRQFLLLPEGPGELITYSFVSAKFNEGVKKRTNPSEAEGQPDIFWISRDENSNMVFKGCDDREYHFF